MPGQPEALLWQFRLTWRLASYHLERLDDQDCLWAPAPHSWSVQRGEDGNWRADWSETEPDPPPAFTAGWVTWHLIWWWSTLLCELNGQAAPERESVFWPGSAAATVARLNALARAYEEFLREVREEDLQRVVRFPWKDGWPLWQVLGWANAELMKNAAEAGCLRLVRAAMVRSAEGDPQ